MLNIFLLIIYLFQLFLQIKAVKFYLTMFVEEVDDCISRIYKIDNETNINYLKKLFMNLVKKYILIYMIMEMLDILKLMLD